MGGLRQSNGLYLVFVVLFESILVAQISSESPCDINLENTLRKLLTDDQPSMQVGALRRELLQKIIDELEKNEEENFKRNLASLASSNNLPYQKRNLESLARAGYIKTLPEEEEDADNFKRSIANLAKNGQLPHTTEEKRGIESLARNGELNIPKKNSQNFMDIYGKRNIASLARNFEFPSYGKRSLSSLARSGDLNFMRSQRNIATLARDGKVKGKREAKSDFLTGAFKQDVSEDKKSFNEDQKITRAKREADYYYSNDEFASPVYQSQNVYDYDDLGQDFDDTFTEQDKRFLGRLPQMGKIKSTPTPKTRRYL